MSAQILDGKALAAKMKANLRTESENLARRPGLAVVLVGDNGASQVYVRNKVADCRDCGIAFPSKKARSLDFSAPMAPVNPPP